MTEETTPTNSSLPPSPSESEEIIYSSEATRTAEAGKESFQGAIEELNRVISSVDDLAKASPEQIVSVLQSVRVKVDTLMKLYSSTPSTAEAIERLREAKAVLEQWHLDSRVKAAAADKTTGLHGEKYFFAIELARDVAKYLSKLADLSGNKEYYLLASKIVEAVPLPADPEADAVPLVQFERLIYLSLGGETVDTAELIGYYQELVRRSENWDRKAITAWQLFEVGVRQKDVKAMQLGLASLRSAVETSDQQTPLSYIAKRLGSKAVGWKRRIDFAKHDGATVIKTLELSHIS